MHRLAILSEDLSVVEVYQADEADVRAVYPELTLGSELRDDSLTEWPRVVLVHDTDKPDTVWGERAVEAADPVNDAGTWRQDWTVETITLAEAKQELAQMAVGLYWSRFIAVPSVAEFQAAGRSGVAVLQARVARFQPAIDDVATRIQNAGNTADAYAIYQELEALS